MASFARALPSSAYSTGPHKETAGVTTELETEEARLALNDAEAYLRLAKAMKEAGMSSVSADYLRKLARQLRQENE